MILSASQIESFRDDNPFGCQTRWWLEKIAPDRKPVIKDLALDIGDATHKTLEAFLKGAGQGVLHDIVINASGALEFLLKLRTRVKAVELEFTPAAKAIPLFQGEYDSTRIGGIDVRGKIDWLATPLTGEELELGDHKTTSNIAKYGKTPGQIKKSVQMNVYAKWLGEKYRPFELLKVTQDFYQTKRGKKFDVQSTTISKRENAESVLSIEATVEEMVKASHLTDPISLKPNFKACHIGYGCPHRAVCPHLKSQGVFDMASLLEAFVGLDPIVAAAVPGNPLIPAVNPPDAPRSDPSSLSLLVAPSIDAGKLKVDPAAHPTDAELEAQRNAPKPPPEPVTVAPVIVPVTPVPTPVTAPAEKSKRTRGRPKGAANKPVEAKPATNAEIAQMQSVVVIPSIPTLGVIKVTKIAIHHGARIALPRVNQFDAASFAEASVDMEAELSGGSVEEGRAALSMNVKAAMVKELEVYAPKAPAAVKPT